MASPTVTGLLVLGFLLLVLLIRIRRAVGTAVSSAAMGVGALAAVNLTGLVTGVVLPWNLFTMLVCLVLGAPGVVSMLVLQLFWVWRRGGVPPLSGPARLLRSLTKVQDDSNCLETKPPQRPLKGRRK